MFRYINLSSPLEFILLQERYRKVNKSFIFLSRIKMRSLLKVIAVAALSLYPAVADNYSLPNPAQAYASSLPLGRSKKYTAKLSYPKPTQAKIDGRTALVYDFPLEDIAIDVLVSKKPQKYGLFIAEAKRKYGSKLEFLTSSTFYHNGLVGRIVKDGKIVNKKKYSLGLDLVYSDEFGLDFISNYEKYPDYADTVVGGLVSLVKNGKQVTSFSNRRIYNKVPRERAAIGIKENGSGILVYSTCTIKGLAGIMTDLECTEAAAIDGGGSRLLYYKGKALKKPTDNIAGVIVGYRTDL